MTEAHTRFTRQFATAVLTDLIARPTGMSAAAAEQGMRAGPPSRSSTLFHKPDPMFQRIPTTAQTTAAAPFPQDPSDCFEECKGKKDLLSCILECEGGSSWSPPEQSHPKPQPVDPSTLLDSCGCPVFGGPYLSLPSLSLADSSTQTCFYDTYGLWGWLETCCCPPLLQKTDTCDPPTSNDWAAMVLALPHHTSYQPDVDIYKVLIQQPTYDDYILLGAALSILVQNRDIALCLTTSSPCCSNMADPRFIAYSSPTLCQLFAGCYNSGC